MAVLARELTLEENGVVVAVLVVSGLVRTMTQGLIAPVLVQREELRPAHVRTASVLAVWWALLLAGLLFIVAPRVEHFFGMDGLASLVRALGPMALLLSLGYVAEGLLQRELELKQLALAETAANLLGYLPAGITVALLGHGPWAIVAAVSAHALIRMLVLIRFRPPSFSAIPDPDAARDIVSFAGGILSARIFSYGATRADYVVIGRMMTDAALGVYGRAYDLMAQPAMFLGEVVDRVLFPLMSRYQSDRRRLGDTFGRGIALVAMITLPASAGAIALAPELVHVVLGPGWEDSVLPFRVLVGALVFRTGYKICDSLIRAAGRVYRRAWRQLLYALMVALGAWFGTRYGVVGVAWGVFAALVGNYLSMAWLSLATTGLDWGRFARAHLRGLALGALTLALAWGLAQALRSQGAGSLGVVGGTTLGALAALGLALWRAPGLVLGPDGTWLVGKLSGRSGG